MRILVHAFEQAEGWIIQCLADDARTTVAPQSRVASYESVVRLLRNVGAHRGGDGRGGLRPPTLEHRLRKDRPHSRPQEPAPRSGAMERRPQADFYRGGCRARNAALRISRIDRLDLIDPIEPNEPNRPDEPPMLF